MRLGYSGTKGGRVAAIRNAKAFGNYNPVDTIISPNCPDCGNPMIRRNGKFGEFFGCSQFSMGCKKTLPLSAGKKSGGAQ